MDSSEAGLLSVSFDTAREQFVEAINLTAEVQHLFSDGEWLTLDTAAAPQSCKDYGLEPADGYLFEVTRGLDVYTGDAGQDAKRIRDTLAADGFDTDISDFDNGDRNTDSRRDYGDRIVVNLWPGTSGRQLVITYYSPCRVGNTGTVVSQLDKRGSIQDFPQSLPPGGYKF